MKILPSFREVKIVFAASVLMFTGIATAATDGWNATVTRILTDNENFGQCMAVTEPSAEDRGLACKSYWVTFSCDGTFNSKSIGNAKYSAAQLAYVTGSQVFVSVDDTKRHNGYCFAQRIDNW